MNRREFIELSAALGATLAWARSTARESRLTWSERRESYPQGVASGDPHPDSVLLWTRRPPATGAAASQITVEIARDREFKHVVSTSQRAAVRGERLDVPHPRRGPRARHRLLVSVHRRRWSRQPHRPHQDGAARDRRAPRELHVRQLPERLPGRAERLSPHDLRGRAPAGRAPARLRAAPRRLHLRDRVVSRGPAAGHVRPPPARPRALQDRREGARLPRARDARRLPRAVSRVSAGSGSAGRPRALAVRVRLGQPRVLVARLAGVHEDRGSRTSRADAQGRCEPGVVRVPAGAHRQAGRRRARAVRRRPQSSTRRSSGSTSTASARNRTTSPQSRACASIAVCASAARSTSCSPTSIRSRPNARWTAPRRIRSTARTIRTSCPRK